MTGGTVRRLAAACVADPADPLPRQVLADHLDECGDHATAYALRWMVRHGRERSKFERRMSPVPSWLPRCVGDELPDVWGRDWLSAVKKLGRALARVKAMVDA